MDETKSKNEDCICKSISVTFFDMPICDLCGDEKEYIDKIFK